MGLNKNYCQNMRRGSFPLLKHIEQTQFLKITYLSIHQYIGRSQLPI